MTYRVFGGQTYTLQSAISSTQTTINLSSFTVPVSGDPVTMALLGTDIVYATIDPKTSSSEFISFTGITQNLDGTAQLTGVTRGLNKTYPYTSDVSFKLPHSGAAQLIISNPPQLYNKLAVLENDNTFTATNNFTGVIKVPTYTSSDIDHAASIEYVNDVAIVGAPDASSTVKGISKLSTNPVSPTNPIAVGDNDTRVPTQGENDALAGTSGTPSSTNKYVTNDDTTGTGSVVRGSYIDSIEWFGDGSDGDVTISVDTTLSRDMFYNNLTINTGKFLYANGYRIFVKGTLTTLGTGKIDRSGNNGANGADSIGVGSANAAGGAALSAGTLAGTAAGGVGGNVNAGNAQQNGSAAASVTNSIGVVGGAGGGPRPTGTVTAASPSIHAPYPVYILDTTAILMRNSTGQFNGSSSGAGGDSSQGNGGTRGGGGGGSSGGIIFISAKEINFAANNSVTVVGGNGGNGGSSGLGDAYGGGGGSGGVIVLIYKTMSGTTLTASTACAAGTGGLGGSSSRPANNGSNGTTGVIYSYQV